MRLCAGAPLVHWRMQARLVNGFSQFLLKTLENWTTCTPLAPGCSASRDRLSSQGVGSPRGSCGCTPCTPDFDMAQAPSQSSKKASAGLVATFVTVTLG